MQVFCGEVLPPSWIILSSHNYQNPHRSFILFFGGFYMLCAYFNYWSPSFRQWWIRPPKNYFPEEFHVKWVNFIKMVMVYQSVLSCLIKSGRNSRHTDGAPHSLPRSWFHTSEMQQYLDHLPSLSTSSGETTSRPSVPVVVSRNPAWLPAPPVKSSEEGVT